MAKTKPKKIGQCVYCGETKPLTKDHVIARCLFPRPLPEFMATVPACDACNFEKSKHDDYLRDMLVVDLNSEKNKTAQTVLNGKVIRSAQTNRSLVIRAAKSNGRFEPVYSDCGIYLGQGFSFPVDSERVNHVFSLIVRGLYHKLTKLYLPKDCSFDVRRLSASDFYKTWDEVQRIGYNGPYNLGGDVFTCIFFYAAEEPALSFWWMWFYDSICVYVKTSPANYAVEILTPTAT
jgi:hypothetical protein